MCNSPHYFVYTIILERYKIIIKNEIFKSPALVQKQGSAIPQEARVIVLCT
jgi:hypothetical protein